MKFLLVFFESLNYIQLAIAGSYNFYHQALQYPFFYHAHEALHCLCTAALGTACFGSLIVQSIQVANFSRHQLYNNICTKVDLILFNVFDVLAVTKGALIVRTFAQCFLISFKVQLFNIVTYLEPMCGAQENLIAIVQLVSQLATHINFMVKEN